MELLSSSVIIVKLGFSSYFCYLSSPFKSNNYKDESPLLTFHLPHKIYFAKLDKGMDDSKTFLLLLIFLINFLYKGSK